jgi:hypothetical protein
MWQSNRGNVLLITLVCLMLGSLCLTEVMQTCLMQAKLLQNYLHYYVESY